MQWDGEKRTNKYKIRNASRRNNKQNYINMNIHKVVLALKQMYRKKENNMQWYKGIYKIII